MAKETLGLKLDPEVAAKFKEIQAANGGTAQDFIETLLVAHTQTQENTDTASPVYKEQIKVRQALASVERVVGSYLELAANDKAVAEEQSRETVKAAQAEVAGLKEKILDDESLIKEIEATNKDLTKKVAGLEDAAESLETLKAAWKEKESSLNTRIEEMNTEAKRVRELAAKVVDLEKELVKKNSALDLATQKMEGLAKEIQSIKDRLEKKDTRIETLEKALDDAKNQSSKEKVDCSIRIAEIQTAAAEEKGRLFGELAGVKDQLKNQDELNSEIAQLKNELKTAANENQALEESMKSLKADLAKVQGKKK